MAEVFALTDEQILGMEAEGTGGEERPASEGGPYESEVARTTPSDGDERRGKKPTLAKKSERGEGGEGLTPEGVSYNAPPRWLAERMRDPWVGEEARELWEGAQRAQREAAAYREAFATPEDARALKELYPGGVTEAKSAAERAGELAEIDLVFFGAPGRPAEELRAGRVQLVERLYAQDPAAFREMVEAGTRILERVGGGQRPATGEGEEQGSFLHRNRAGHDAEVLRASSSDALRMTGAANEVRARSSGSAGTAEPGERAQPGIIPQNARDGAAVAVPPEVASRYREFERATNAELEKSVGGAIGKAMEAVLPNLRWTQVGREGQAPPLQERLRTAVREDVEAALKSDAALGEQVARVLSGRRFDDAARAQVVRLIDARAQQLVPGAVRRVVGSWTAATLGARKTESGGEERKTIAAARAGNDRQTNARSERAAAQDGGRKLTRGRVDYRKWSDEQILEM